MKQIIREHPVSAFFVLCYIVSWTAMLPVYLSITEKIGPQYQAFVFLARYGPSIAGILVAMSLYGREGLSTLYRRAVRWRIGKRWWLIVSLLPALIILAGLATHFLATGSLDVHDQLRYAVFFPLRLLQHTIIGGGFGEEIGWRGVALPLLLARFGGLRASVIIGLLWAGWHLPNVLISGLWQQWIFVYVPNVVAISIILTWIYLNTGRSLLAVVMFHANINAMEWLFAQIFVHKWIQETWSYNIGVGLAMWICVAFIIWSQVLRTADSGSPLVSQQHRLSMP